MFPIICYVSSNKNNDQNNVTNKLSPPFFFFICLSNTIGKGHGNQLQYSCLKNPMDRGAWWAAVHWVAKELDTTEATKQHVGQDMFKSLRQELNFPDHSVVNILHFY